jgi:hypothetical protein
MTNKDDANKDLANKETIKNILAGPVTWDALREELLGFSKETLAEMVSMWVDNYWANQSYWVSFVERDFGQENAERLDGEIFKKTARIQAKSLKKLFGFGDDMQAAAFMLRYVSTQWPTAGFRWEIDELTEERLVFHVNQCPMGTYRKANGLELFHCKAVSSSLYDAMMKAVNPLMKATCTHAHPDAPVEDLMCAWEVVYEDAGTGAGSVSGS